MFSVETAVSYLVNKRFGITALLKPALEMMQKNQNFNAEKSAQIIEIENYEKSLRAKPADELEHLYKKALVEDESSRFYSVKSANADFVHWSKAAHWTLDEAIALSFGKEPDKVTWKKIEPLKDKTAFANAFSKRRDLALRATRWKKFGDTIPPIIFIDWAKQLKIELPLELLGELANIGCTATNWREQYQALKTAHDDLAMQLSHKPENTLKPESARKVDNLLQAITCIAIDSYRYDPKLEKSNVPQQISDDISKSGKAIDTKTIRGWLKEGLALLPAKPHKD